MKKTRIKLPSKWTAAKVRQNAKGDVQVSISPAKVKTNPGTGAFARCVKSVESRGGAYSPSGVCATEGRRKYGKKRFAAMAAAGRRRAARNLANAKKRANAKRRASRRRTRR